MKSYKLNFTGYVVTKANSKEQAYDNALECIVDAELGAEENEKCLRIKIIQDEKVTLTDDDGSILYAMKKNTEYMKKHPEVFKKLEELRDSLYTE